ncbi:hypothetical protein AMJ80_11455 [bacterium SM23_31]|nr:MAG: hypothetical protein AMJ80_11455 [bacterium SM23_31]
MKLKKLLSNFITVITTLGFIGFIILLLLIDSGFQVGSRKFLMSSIGSAIGLIIAYFFIVFIHKKQLIEKFEKLITYDESESKTKDYKEKRELMVNINEEGNIDNETKKTLIVVIWGILGAIWGYAFFLGCILWIPTSITSLILGILYKVFHLPRNILFFIIELFWTFGFILIGILIVKRKINIRDWFYVQ